MGGVGRFIVDSSPTGYADEPWLFYREMPRCNASVCVRGEARTMQSVEVAARAGSLVVVYFVLGSAVCPEKDMFEFVLLLS